MREFMHDNEPGLYNPAEEAKEDEMHVGDVEMLLAVEILKNRVLTRQLDAAKKVVKQLRNRKSKAKGQRGKK